LPYIPKGREGQGPEGKDAAAHYLYCSMLPIVLCLALPSKGKKDGAKVTKQ